MMPQQDCGIFHKDVTVKTIKLISISALVSILTACGGGSDDGKPSGNTLMGNKNAPEATSFPTDNVFNVQEGEPFEITGFAFDDADGNDVSVSFKGGPSWLSWDDEKQAFIGTPVGADDHMSITVVLDDIKYQVDSWTFSLVVNGAPYLEGSLPQEAIELGVGEDVSPLFSGMAIKDGDGDSVIAYLDNAPEWLSLHDGVMTGKPEREGHHDGIRIMLDDGHAPVMAWEFSITVTPPEFMAWRIKMPGAMSEGDRFQLQATPYDDAMDDIQLSADVDEQGTLMLQVPNDDTRWSEYSVTTTWTHGEYSDLTRLNVDMQSVVGSVGPDYQPNATGMAAFLPTYESTAYHTLISGYSQGFETSKGVPAVSAKAVPYHSLVYVAMMAKLAHENGLLFNLNKSLNSMRTKARIYPGDIADLSSSANEIRLGDSSLINDRYWSDLLAQERAELLEKRRTDTLEAGTWSALSPSSIEFGAGLGISFVLGEDGTYQRLTTDKNSNFMSTFGLLPERGNWSIAQDGVALLLGDAAEVTEDTFYASDDPLDTSFALRSVFGVDKLTADKWAEAIYRADVDTLDVHRSTPDQLLIRLHPEGDSRMRAASAELQFAFSLSAEGISLSGVGVEASNSIMLQQHHGVSSAIVFDPLKYDLLVALPSKDGVIERAKQVRLDLYDNYLVRQISVNGNEILPWEWDYNDKTYTFTFTHTEVAGLTYEVVLLDQAADGRFELGNEGLSYTYGARLTIAQDGDVLEVLPAQALLHPKSACQSGDCDDKTFKVDNVLWTKGALGQESLSQTSGWLLLPEIDASTPREIGFIRLVLGGDDCQDQNAPCYALDEHRRLRVSGASDVWRWEEVDQSSTSSSVVFALDVKGKTRMFLSESGLTHYRGKDLSGSAALANSLFLTERPAEETP
jgi:hypothetical protein